MMVRYTYTCTTILPTFDNLIYFLLSTNLKLKYFKIPLCIILKKHYDLKPALKTHLYEYNYISDIHGNT